MAQIKYSGSIRKVDGSGRWPMNEKETKIAATHSHFVQCGETNFSLNSEFVSEMKGLLILLCNRSNEKLVLLKSSLSNWFEPTLKYSFGRNRQENEYKIFESMLFFYLTQVSVRFLAKQKNYWKSKSQGYYGHGRDDNHTVHIQNARNVPPLGVYTDNSAVAV